MRAPAEACDRSGPARALVGCRAVPSYLPPHSPVACITIRRVWSHVAWYRIRLNNRHLGVVTIPATTRPCLRLDFTCLMVLGCDTSHSASVLATSEGITAASPVRAGYYAAPTGTSRGDGSFNQPWDLVTGLAGAGGRVRPGDTLWLRGGTYRGAFVSTLTGMAAAPIVVRQYPGERATIDGRGATACTFTIDGAWAVFWGFEIMNSGLDRYSYRPCPVYVRHTSHVKVVNLIVHDGGVALYTEPGATDIEVYGCLIYNNGYQTTRGNGHALYVKSDAGPVYLRDNIMFNQFNYGVHAYSNAGSGGLNNIHVEGNVSFNNGIVSTAGANAGAANILLGGYEPMRNTTATDNMTYFSPGYGVYNVVLGLDTVLNTDAGFQNNYVVGCVRSIEAGFWRSLTVTGNEVLSATRMAVLDQRTVSGYTWNGNRYFRDPAALAWRYGSTDYSFAGWRSATGLGARDQAVAALPTQPQLFVRPNRFEPGRATIVVYNWPLLAAVAVNLSGVLQIGDRYELRNAQDYFGAPLLSGTFGGTLSVPMTGVAPPAIIGGSPNPPQQTGPAFDVFIVQKVTP